MNNWQAGALGVLLGLFASSSDAQSATSPRDVPTEMVCQPSITDAAKMLLDGYGETPLVAGQTGTGGVMIIFGNTASGTWTLVFIMPDGAACSPASGTNLVALLPGELV